VIGFTRGPKPLRPDIEFARLSRLLAAAHNRMRHGHHEKCVGQLVQTNKCICGFDGLGESLEAFDDVEWRDSP